MNDLGIYKYDAMSGVWSRTSGPEGYGYSDGEAEEVRLLEIITTCRDRGVYSRELSEQISSWPQEYHLSRKRHLLAHHLKISAGSRVIELGAGCGAITRFLGDTGADVIAVEGSKVRSKIIVERCKGLPNVKVINEDLTKLHQKSVGQFDYVFMIGVLEYSTRYVQDGDPFLVYLDIAKSLLSKDGILILAIENKLGVKYLNGAAEDHNGRHFYGVEGLYRDGDVSTLGRREIKDKLALSGFADVELFGVFPDYKLPRAIISERADAFRQFRSEELVLNTKSLDYAGFNQRLFQESLFLGEARKNGIFTDLANSFLIVAKQGERKLPVESRPLAYYYSPNRRPELCCVTRFEADGNSLSVVKERLLHSNSIVTFSLETQAGVTLNVSHRVGERSPYEIGESLAVSIIKDFQRGDLKVAVHSLGLWLAFLLRSHSLKYRNRAISQDELVGLELADLAIDGAALDFNPCNVIVSNGVPVSIDKEWSGAGHIPLGWVIRRGVGALLALPALNQYIGFLDEIVRGLVQSRGLVIRETESQTYQALEDDFGAAVSYYERSDRTPLQFVKLQ